LRNRESRELPFIPTPSLLVTRLSRVEDAPLFESNDKAEALVISVMTETRVTIKFRHFIVMVKEGGIDSIDSLRI
jgi:hypothetical protein